MYWFLDAGFALSGCVIEEDILFIVRVNPRCVRETELPPYCGKGPGKRGSW